MPKVLLVEDDPMIYEIYQRKFEASGFEVEVATNGKQVLEKARQGAFDVILLDLVLPEMGGMDVLAELRHNSHYDPNLKIIILSNLNEKEDREKALQLGVNGFIQKTEYSPSRLVEEVRRFLRQFEERKKNDTRRSEGGRPEQNQKRILFIEDEAVFAEMFGRRLEDEGYAVAYADNGVTGVSKALEEPFDLIITDMVMPGMGGQEIIQQLKRDDRTKDIPIFLFSASVEEKVLEEAKCYGAAQCFLKTRLTPSELITEVNAFLGGPS